MPIGHIHSEGVGNMANITLKEIPQYKSYGRAIEFTNAKLTAIVTLDIGPRIMHVSLPSLENLFADEVDLQERLPDGRVYNFYGGHRVWHSPEAFPRSYMPDGEPLERYELYDDGILMIQKEEECTQIQKTVEVHFTDRSLKVKSSLTNCGAWPVEMAVWSLIIGSPRGREILPVTQRNTGLLANTHYVSWSYSKMNDERVYWGQRYITLDQDPLNATPFKLGYPNEFGWMCYFNHGQCFVKKFTHIRGAKYPDFGSSWQTHTAGWGIDIESLSPLQIVKPGKTISHEEEWFVFAAPKKPNTDENEIAEILEPFSRAAGFELPVVNGEGWVPSFNEEE